MAAIEAGRGAATTGFSEAYRRGVVAFLLAAYTFNFIDRTIVSTIGQAIKVDLKLSDTQLGLLGGPAFALLYTLMGVPIARLAERRNRVSIISAALVVWSGFTVACGLAANFAILLAMRVGVGIGEAGCSPPSHSLISDYFEPRRRASALGVYAFGIPLGSMIGAVSGGWLAEHAGWRVAFMIVGAPGVLLAIAVKLFVREPPRGHADTSAVAVERPAGEISELWTVTKVLFGSWPMINMMLGITLVSLAGYGIGAFAAPYLVRAFGLSYTLVGLIQGLLWGVAGGAGTLAGGFVSDFASRRGAKWYALTPAIGVAIATPFFAAGYMALDWHVAVVLLGIPLAFVYVYLAPTFSVVQNVVEARRRATAAAIMLLFLNLIALAGGPLLVGWMIDRFAAFDFAHPQTRSLVDALAALSSGGQFPCPGGLAPKGAGAAMALACHSAEALATRQGILVTVSFYGWGALHYLLASFGLERRLSRAGQGV